jgi:hypothetical protein
MPKVSAKNGIILVGGVNVSTLAMQYQAEINNGMIDVTGFTEAGQNFIPGLPTGKMTVDFFWDSTATVGANALFQPMGQGIVTLLPEGWLLGNPTISMPFTQGNYTPQGAPAEAIKLGSLAFEGYGSSFVGIENGYALQHGTTTATLTGTGFDDPLGAAVTKACGASLHIWSKTTTDTYVIKVQHSTALGSGYADLITFSANGTALTAERQVVASGTINRYRRILATRTGAAGDTLGFTVAFYHL